MVAAKATVVRTPRVTDHPYFMMARATAQNEALSFAARGMLAYLLSKPDDWRVDVGDLQQKCGRDKVYSLLKELIENKYIVRKTIRNAKRQIVSIEYIVHECPLTAFPDTAPPDTAKADSLHSTDGAQNRESTNKTSAEGETPPPQSTTLNSFFRAGVLEAIPLTKSKYYVVNVTAKKIGNRTFTKAKAEAYIAEQGNPNRIAVRGEELLSDPQYHKFELITLETERVPVFDAIAECGFNMPPNFNPDALNGNSGRVGDIIKSLAALLNKTHKEVSHDAELAKQVRAMYDWRKKNKLDKQGRPLDAVKHPNSFIPAWGEYQQILESAAAKAAAGGKTYNRQTGKWEERK